MSGSWILVHTAIAIVIVILLLVSWRINPAIGLVIGAMYLGVVSGVGLADTMATVAQGFGNIMAGVGLVIGFGVLLGSLLLAAGGVDQIAESMLRIFGSKKSPYAITVTGITVSTPVFYDVGYVIMAPLAKAITLKTAFSIAALGGALVFGLGIAHTFIPPTPGPIGGAELLQVSLGEVFIYGVLVAVPTAIIGLYLFLKMANRSGFWREERDQEQLESEDVESEAVEGETSEKRPTLALSLLPIVLPIGLILLGTVSEAVGWEADWIRFMGDKVTALLVRLLVAFWVAARFLPKQKLHKAFDEGMKSSGIVLLITGAGGAFAAVIQAAGVGEVLGEFFTGSGGGSVVPILMVWLIAGLLRAAQGSGTVAMITAASIIAPVAMSGGLDVSPVLLALAAFSGSLLYAHINDSGFWITMKLLGLSTVGGLKVYTLPCAISSLLSLVFILMLNVVL